MGSIMAKSEDEVFCRLAVDRLAEHDNDADTAFRAFRADVRALYDEEYDGTRLEFTKRATNAWIAALDEPVVDLTDEPPDPPKPFAIDALHEVYIRRSDLRLKAAPGDE
jgi:hypothetical protein